MSTTISSTKAVAGDSKVIVTNQPGIHEKLDVLVKKHLAKRSQKPFQPHTKAAFEQVNSSVEKYIAECKVSSINPEVILDSCCGVGQSTRLLAKNNPQALVIGVDKSAHRINRNVEEVTHDNGEGINNYQLVRADLNDFYRLVVNANWPIKKHYILYPNPWPKSKHVQRRWHGSAVFPEILEIGQQIILRSNWLLYLQEFQFAAKIAGINSDISEVAAKPGAALTPFEAKYQTSGQVCWQLILNR